MRFNVKKAHSALAKNHAQRSVGRDLDEINDLTEAIQSFGEALALEGWTLPTDFAPGQKVRIAAKGKGPTNKSATCFMRKDGSGGWVQDFVVGVQWTWSNGSPIRLTLEQREANLELTTKSTDQQVANQMQARKRAAEMLKNATRAEEHPYLTKKGVEGHGIKLDGNLLLVPIRDTKNQLQSVQTITPAGDKRFLSGGRKKGCFFRMGRFEEVSSVVVCEGFATGASIRESTDLPVAVAFDAGNLLPVALAIHETYPEAQIILAADDDFTNEVNTGITKAKAAAQAVSGLLAVPDFGANRPEGATDFNDLHHHLGSEAVKHCIDAAAPPRPDDWPECQPLLVQYKTKPYPLDALPVTVRCAVNEVARFVKAPVALIATSALAAISLALQAFNDVQRTQGLTGPTGLFLLVIADSGERKSSCDKYFTKAIREYVALKREEAKPLIEAYKAEYEAWAAKCSGLKERIKANASAGKPSAKPERELQDLHALEPKRPRVPKLFYMDATPEALGLSLVKNWPSGGIISSEGGSVLGGHGMTSDSKMRYLSLLNQLWDGADISVERKTSESFTVSGVRLTVALQVQEPTIREFFSNDHDLARGSGFMARFLMCWPDSTQGTRNYDEAPAGWPAVEKFNQRLTVLLNQNVPMDDNGALTPSMLTFSPEAHTTWVAFHDAVEFQLREGGKLRDVRDVASKSADNAARLAALFHAFERTPGPIDGSAMEAGAVIAQWHLSEARRFLGELAMPSDLVAPLKLEKWLLSYCNQRGIEKVSTREVQQGGPGSLRKQEKLNQAIQVLAEHGRIRVVQDGKKKLVQIRPELLHITPKTSSRKRD
jgi:putative DNA primase/helicase